MCDHFFNTVITTTLNPAFQKISIFSEWPVYSKVFNFDFNVLQSGVSMC